MDLYCIKKNRPFKNESHDGTHLVIVPRRPAGGVDGPPCGPDDWLSLGGHGGTAMEDKPVSHTRRRSLSRHGFCYSLLRQLLSSQ